jgi:chorismate mutase
MEVAAVCFFRAAQVGELVFEEMGTNEQMTIHDWRTEIDEVDRALVELLNRRARLAAAVGEVKRTSGLPLWDPVRERHVLENARQASNGPLEGAALDRIFRRIVLESKRVEARLVEASEVEPDEVLR